MSMESKGWDAAVAIKLLLEEGSQFELFQMIRLLENYLLANHDGMPHELLPIGKQTFPEKELLVFINRVSLQFTIHDVSKLTLLDDQYNNHGFKLQLETPILGLLGIVGALPDHYTELVNNKVKNKDFVLKRFLDLFQHRLMSLYYRAWKKHHFFVGYENAMQLKAPKYDLFSKMLGSFVGIESNDIQEQLKVHKEHLLFYSGVFAKNIRSALSLQLILQHYLALPIQVKQFQGQWLYLKKEEFTVPGKFIFKYNALGQEAVIGKKVWDLQSKFRIIIGPINYEQLLNFLPTRELFEKIIQLVKLYVGLALGFDFQLLVTEQSIPVCRVNKAYLGWNTWLRGINKLPGSYSVILREIAL